MSSATQAEPVDDRAERPRLLRKRIVAPRGCRELEVELDRWLR